MTHKEFLFYILDVFEKNDLPYFLMCGTLLGAVRENNFLPGDHADTDIGIDVSYRWKLRNIVENTPHLYYQVVRRNEITIGYRGESFKLDIFFMEQDNEKYWIYSYKKNENSGRWDIEWRAWFSYNLFFPLTKVIFMDRPCNAPGQYKNVLSEHYGEDWTIPNDKFSTGSKQKIDSEYKGKSFCLITNEIPIRPKKTIGMVIVNFLRHESTLRCIESLTTNYPEIQIYLGEQDAPNQKMWEFYERNNVKFFYLPFDCGLSIARNFLVEQVIEPYIMWGDNDFIYNANCHIEHGKQVLDSSEEIGLVGGSVHNLQGKMLHYERLLSYIPEQEVLIYTPLELVSPKEHIFNDIKYYYCDMVFNFVIGRTSLFKNNSKLRWNPSLKVAYEHSDFFLRMKVFDNHKVVYCPSMTVIHAHVSDATYDIYRFRKTCREAFYKDWGLKMNFTIGRGREIYETGKVTNYEALSREVK